MDYTDQSIRGMARITEMRNGGGLVMTIEIRSSDNDWLDVNDRPVIDRDNPPRDGQARR